MKTYLICSAVSAAVLSGYGARAVQDKYVVDCAPQAIRHRFYEAIKNKQDPAGVLLEAKGECHGVDLHKTFENVK